MLKKLVRIYRDIKRRLKSQRKQIDNLYKLLYNMVHDLEESVNLTAAQTAVSFSDQWKKFPDGDFLLSDPWFKSNVADIIEKEELQISREWIKGKKVLDAGCGNGRWSYGLAQLGGDMTCVDINQSAIDATKEALKECNVEKQFTLSPLETVADKLSGQQFDLVYSWGVVHHCQSFNKSLNQLCSLVKDDGVLFLYLYGRERLNMTDDIELFKERIAYNLLDSEADKLKFLMKKAKGDRKKLNMLHDYYSPLINRRLDYSYVKGFLENRGFELVERNKKHPELFIRAVKSKTSDVINHFLPEPQAPFWFQRDLGSLKKIYVK